MVMVIALEAMMAMVFWLRVVGSVGCSDGCIGVGIVVVAVFVAW